MKNLNNHLTSAIAIAALAVMTLFSGCEYEFVEPEKTVPITTPVSFTTDVMPIFNLSCNMSSCHGTGDWAPDLTAANAYNSLMQGSYIDTANPAGSSFYVKIKTGSMKSFTTASQASVILAWIQQGALNN